MPQGASLFVLSGISINSQLQGSPSPKKKTKYVFETSVGASSVAASSVAGRSVTTVAAKRVTVEVLWGCLLKTVCTCSRPFSSIRHKNNATRTKKQVDPRRREKVTILLVPRRYIPIGIVSRIFYAFRRRIRHEVYIFPRALPMSF